MRSTKTKEQIFRDGFSLFVNGQIPDDIFQGYMNDEDGEATSRLQFWIVDNMRGEIYDWATGIGIIEAVELMYESALANGNNKMDKKSNLSQNPPLQHKPLILET
jgi:hypothetical protein